VNASDGSAAYECRIVPVSPRVSTEDLIDAQGVADILGLSHRNTVFQYQRRYDDMPEPVVDLGDGRVKLWLRPQIERWAARVAAQGRTRRKRRN
jgi:glutathione-regulated potassium-efflux system ancillary protein KefG